MPDNTKPTIAVSSCLLGNNVRYDGEHKQHSSVVTLCQEFNCIAVCPEVAIGLGVPRPPVQLVQFTSIQAIGVNNPDLNITQALKNYAAEMHNTLPLISGYVFKARSPSCGVASTPLFDPTGKQLGNSTGIYAFEIQRRFPDLPLIEESDLEHVPGMESFSDQVWDYYHKNCTER